MARSTNRPVRILKAGKDTRLSASSHEPPPAAADGDPDEQVIDYPIKSVRKAMAILDALSEARRPLRVSDLASRLAMSVSAVSRLVATLSSGGLVYQEEETGRCYLGFGLAILGCDAFGRRELDRLATPVLDELASRSSCYISLSRLERGKAVIMRARTGASSARDLNLFSVVPLHACSPGKVLTSALPTEIVRTMLAEHGMDPFTANTLTDVDAFISEIGQAKDCGFAIDNEEVAYGLRHVASPIFDQQGHVVAAMSAGGSLTDLPLEAVGSMIQMLHHGCLRVSRELGYRGAPNLKLEALSRFAPQGPTPFPRPAPDVPLLTP